MYMYTHTYGTAYIIWHIQIHNVSNCNRSTFKHDEYNIKASDPSTIPPWLGVWLARHAASAHLWYTNNLWLSTMRRYASYLKTHQPITSCAFLQKSLNSCYISKDLFQSKSHFTLQKKSEVAAMKVLFKDEKYTSKTIGILVKLMEDGNLNGQSQVRHHTHIQVVSIHIHIIHTHRIGVASQCSLYNAHYSRKIHTCICTYYVHFECIIIYICTCRWW